MEDVTCKTGEIVEGIKKGEMAQGTIIRITDGVAKEFMSEDQVEKRRVHPDDPFTEMEIGIPDRGVILNPISFKDYTRIGTGGIPLNSRMGQIMGVCDLKVDATLPLIAREVQGRGGGVFTTWEIAI